MGRGTSKGIEAGVDDEEARRRQGSRPSSSSLHPSLPPFFSLPLWATLGVSLVVANVSATPPRPPRLDQSCCSSRMPFQPYSLVADTTPLAAFARH